MMKQFLAAFLSASMLAAAAASAQAEPLAGTWLTQDASTQVRFEACGEMTCGRIVWLREPIDPDTGKDWRDKFNGDDALKRRPLTGLIIVSGLAETGPGKWEGDLYNPEDGRTYGGSFRALDASKIELKGCAMAGLICQTEVWTRAAQ